MVRLPVPGPISSTTSVDLTPPFSTMELTIRDSSDVLAVRLEELDALVRRLLPAFFAFFATPPATRIPVPDMTTVTRVSRGAPRSLRGGGDKSRLGKPSRRSERRAPAAPARRIFFSPPWSSRENPQTPAVSGGALGESLKI